MAKPSLLPPNATRLERALEAATTRLDALPTPIRDTWNPDTCPAALLPWMAWGLGLQSWQPYWPEAVKRAHLRHALAIARERGTRSGIERVVTSFGSGIAVREWYESDPPRPPFTFDVLLTVGQFAGATAADLQRDIAEEIDRAKRASTHWTLQLGLQASGGINVAGGGRLAAFRRFTLSEA